MRKEGQTVGNVIPVWAAVCDFSERGGILSHPDT